MSRLDDLVQKLSEMDLNALAQAKSLSKKQARLLTDLRKEIEAEINRSDSFLDAKRMDTRKKRLERMLEMVDGLIQSFINEGRTITGQAAGEALGNSARLTVSAINVVLGEQVFKPVKELTRMSQLEFEGATISQWWTKLKNETKDKIRREMSQSLLYAETPQQAKVRIRNLLGVTNRQASAISRTALLKANNQGFLDAMKENEALFDGYQWISTLDSRTTIYCVGRSGLRWNKEYKPIGHSIPFQAGPPAHWNCRSRLVPFWDDEDTLPPSVKTRASVVGYANADMSFREFIKRSGVAPKYFGKERLDLFLSGKITQTDLLNSIGEPRSLKELLEMI